MSSLPIDYRPTDFEEFIGSGISIKALKSKIEKDDPPHSYLIHGPSGCGKTTLGRIVASWLINTDNIENNMNYMELDAASFGLKDTVRDIRKKMKMAPIGGDKARVWLLDECHKLTPDAQEVLLKALEDTPSHVYFILATTEPEKLKITLKRRCLPIEVFPVDEEDMTTFLNQIVEEEEKEIFTEPAIIESFNSFTEKITGTDVKFEMIAIQGGSFKMGSNENEWSRKPDEGPVHNISITSFFMGQYPIK